MRAEDFLVAGAGISGAVLARGLAEAGARVRVMEARDHVGGNCHTARDPETGVLQHVYGPHIFHTDDVGVWEYVNRFARFCPYRHRVMSRTRGRVYSLPINLLTINQFFGRSFSPDEARRFIRDTQAQPIANPVTFEQQALKTIGRALYQAFFAGYTQKQWGVSPRALPAAVLKRLPVRFDYDDSYFSQEFQALPVDGYTRMIARMLDHPGITLTLGQAADRHMTADYDHVFCTAPLDGWYGHDLGRLAYRTLDFRHSRHRGDYQGVAVMNHADVDVPQTRVSEHKHFAPWESHAETIVTHEYSRAAGPGDIPYYPIRLAREKAVLAKYQARARAEIRVTFLGRLGTYRYLDMDVCVRESLDLVAAFARMPARQPPRLRA